jgi:hypothetical protein
MTRGSLVVALMFVTLLGLPSQADANLWDWIQEFSGPGPAHGRGSLLSTLCFGEGGHIRSRTTVTASGSVIKVPCVFVDVRRFENEDDDNFPSKVRTTAYDFGPAWELWDQG